MGAGQSRDGYDPRNPYNFAQQQTLHGSAYGTYADPGRKRRLRGYSDTNLPHRPPYPPYPSYPPPSGFGPPPPHMGYPTPGYPGHPGQYPGHGPTFGAQQPYGQAPPNVPPQRPPSPRPYEDPPPRPLPRRPTNVYTMPKYRHLRRATTQSQFSFSRTDRTDLSSSTEYEIVRPGEDDPAEVIANAMNGSSFPFVAAHQPMSTVPLTPAAVPLPETPATMFGQPSPESMGAQPPPFIPPFFELEGLPGSSRLAAGPPISFDGSNPADPFSVYSNHKIFYKKKLYPSAAHLYHAHMFLGLRPNIAEEIRAIEDPKSVRFFAQRRDADKRTDWQAISRSKMDETLYAKFAQHGDLRESLLETDSRALVNADASDSIWGVGNDGTGSNELGKALMRVRDRFIRENGPR